MAEKRIVDIGPLLEDLKNELEGLKGATEVLTVEEAAEDEIEVLKKLPVIDPEKMIPAWRNPDEVYNNQIDRPVVGWMPLPKLPWEEEK